MTETLPDNLWSPDDVDTFDQLHADLATMQGSVQSALNQRAVKSFKWANDTERLAQTGMSAGDSGFQADTEGIYRYNGTIWVPTPVFPPTVVSSTGSGSVNLVGSLQPIVGLSLDTTINIPVTTTVKVTLIYRGNTATDTTGYHAGVNITGATTLTLTATDPRVTLTAGPTNITYNVSYITTVNAGNNTFTLLGQAIGSGGVRNISNPMIIVEAV